MSAGTYSFKGTADFKQHDDAIRNAKKEVTKYKDEVDKAKQSTEKLTKVNFSGAYNSQKKLQNSVKNTTTVLTGLQGNMLGAIGKFGPYAAAATAAVGVAFKTMQKAIKTSDEMMDKYESTVKGVTAATDEMAYSLAHMDFSNFISNCKTAYQNAKALYGALDDLGTFTIINDAEINKLEAQLEEARYEAKKGVKGASERVAQLEDELVEAYNRAKPRMERAKQAAMNAALNWDVKKAHKYGTTAQNMWNAMINFKSMDPTALEDYREKVESRIEQITKGKTKAQIVSLPQATLKELKGLQRELYAIEKAARITDDQLRGVFDQDNNIAAINRKIAQVRKKDLNYIGDTSGDKDDKKPKYEIGSIAEIEAQIKERQDKIKNKPFDIPVILNYEKEIKDLENKKALMELQLQFSNPQDEVDRIFADIFDVACTSDKPEEIARAMAERIDMFLQAQPELQLPPVIFPDEKMKEDAKKAMEEVHKVVVEETEKFVKEMEDSWGKWGSGIDSMGESVTYLGETIGTFNEKSGSLISMLGNITSAAGEAISKVVALAAANGVSSAFELPFPANMAAIAAVLAAVASAASAIHSYSTQKFAGGGVFDGDGPMFGDMHIARVNPGEMILNDRQQANLFRLLNGNVGTQGTMGGGHVEFHIRGSELVGVLDNHHSKMNKIRP